MINKILITVIIPDYEQEYEMYIPNNKKIGTIKNVILKIIDEQLKSNLEQKQSQIRLIDKNTNMELYNDICVKDSGIKNGSNIIVI